VDVGGSKQNLQQQGYVGCLKSFEPLFTVQFFT